MSDDFKFPDLWHDDEYMDFMFLSFPDNQDVNKIAYVKKVNFWCDIVNEYCIKKKIIFITTNILQTLFMRNKSIPDCLNEICHTLHRLIIYIILF